MSTRRLRIGELAERSGRTARTLHFYEEIGLLAPVARTKGGFREYEEDVLFRIEWIGRLQELGFSLPDIRAFLANLHANPTGPEMMAELRGFYESKLEETRLHIKRLRALELELASSLTYLTTCRACAPATEKAACRTCTDDEHLGAAVPPMVVAVRPSHALEVR